MMPRLIRPLIIPLLLLLPGCQPAAKVEPSFDSIATGVFASSCSTRSCHGQAGGKGGLVLTPDVAYDQLVNVPAENEAAKAKGKKRVVPGDPDASFLVQKLTGPGPDEGDLMPQRGGHLPPEQLAAIRAWIAAGAPRQPAAPAPGAL